MPMRALSRTDTSPTETLTSPFCCELFAANAGTAIAQAASAAANHAETSLFVRVILPPFAGRDARLQSCPWQTGGYLPPPQKSKPWLCEPEKREGGAGRRAADGLPKTRSSGGRHPRAGILGVAGVSCPAERRLHQGVWLGHGPLASSARHRGLERRPPLGAPAGADEG